MTWWDSESSVDDYTLLDHSVSIPPATDPILALDLAKTHLRVRHSHEDTDITDLVAEGTGIIERRTGRCLAPRTGLVYRRSHFPRRGAIALPRGPVTSVTSIQYVDPNGTTQTLITTDITTGVPGLIGEPDSGWPVTAERTSAVTITYDAGYAVGECPRNLVRALKLWIDLEYHEDKTPAEATAILQRINDVLSSWQVRDNRFEGLRTG